MDTVVETPTSDIAAYHCCDIAIAFQALCRQTFELMVYALPIGAVEEQAWPGLARGQVSEVQ